MAQDKEKNLPRIAKVRVASRTELLTGQSEVSIICDCCDLSMHRPFRGKSPLAGLIDLAELVRRDEVGS